jgi:hypothetical protein
VRARVEGAIPRRPVRRVHLTRRPIGTATGRGRPIGTSPGRGRLAARHFAAAWGALALAGLVLPALPALGLGVSAAGAVSSSSLSQFLLKSDEMPGYTVGGHPSTVTTPAGLLEGGSLTKSQRKSAISTLQKAGFVKAVEQSAKGSNTNEGLSLVMQFSTAAGAKSAAALFLHIAKTGQAGSKPFNVAGVPGAKGVTVTGSAGGSANAYWTAGNCAFGSGVYDGTATSAKAAASPVQAGIKSQAKRVGSTCP